jgi:AcrR family transcriptional regulator
MSSSNAQNSAAKKRNYRLGRRAEKQAVTRQRIVEAAVDLHSSLGPARTTVSQIAERAGVQRHTYYAHFPEERDLFLACSGLALERDPLPDPSSFRSIPAGLDRLRRGLKEFYDWYERNAQQAACVLRDADDHALTREIVELRMMPVLREAGEVLGEGLNKRSRALLGVAMDFACWRNLSRSLTSKKAAQLMSEAVIKVGPR